MTQSSVAVSVNGDEWVLLNASPDIRDQLNRTRALHPQAVRGSPIQAVILTNADVDHVAGLLTLRERTGFSIYASAETLAALADNPIFGVLDMDMVARRPITIEKPFSPVKGLAVTPFVVPGKVALYLEGDQPDTAVMGGQTIGLCVVAGDVRLYYVPGCAVVPDWLVERLSDADILMFDGTVWSDDEMSRTGTGEKTGGRMGHVAMSGAAGSLARLAALSRCRKVFVHLNNTNPALQPLGSERATIESHGWTIAQDGMEFRL